MSAKNWTVVEGSTHKTCQLEGDCQKTKHNPWGRLRYIPPGGKRPRRWRREDWAKAQAFADQLNKAEATVAKVADLNGWEKAHPEWPFPQSKETQHGRNE